MQRILFHYNGLPKEKQGKGDANSQKLSLRKAYRHKKQASLQLCKKNLAL